MTDTVLQALAITPDVLKDAQRYRWLREQSWMDNLCVVDSPKSSVKLGSFYPSQGRLDSLIDTVIDKAMGAQMTEVKMPEAWAVTACSKMFMGESAELDAKAEAQRCGGTCVAYALYSAPVIAPNVLKDAERYRFIYEKSCQVGFDDETLAFYIRNQPKLDDRIQDTKRAFTAAMGGAND